MSDDWSNDDDDEDDDDSGSGVSVEGESVEGRTGPERLWALNVSRTSTLLSLGDRA